MARKPSASRSSIGKAPKSAVQLTDDPQFAETQPSLDPEYFSVKHGTDSQAYSILEPEKGKFYRCHSRLLPEPSNPC